MGSLADDRWHVRMAPGEVKVLTLDQIDDLFRLEMIDGDTLVRQDGTDQWLPLRVVAGLDDEGGEAAASAPAPPQPSAPPPARSAPPAIRSAPPPPPAPLPPPGAPAPFTHSPSFVPPPASTAPRMAPPSAPAPSYVPTPSHPPAPSHPAPSHPPAPSYAPPIVAPIARLPFTPAMAPPRASRIESLLIALAALLGLMLALQRNGALATLFASAGQAAAYAKLEATLGGPAFGTPRAVDALTSPTRALPAK